MLVFVTIIIIIIISFDFQLDNGMELVNGTAAVHESSTLATSVSRVSVAVVYYYGGQQILFVS